MGAAFALRTGGPPRRVEEHAPSVSAEQITAMVSQRGFVIVVLVCGAVLEGRRKMQTKISGGI
jgi:hypothetical protein